MISTTYSSAQIWMGRTNPEDVESGRWCKLPGAALLFHPGAFRNHGQAPGRGEWVRDDDTIVVNPLITEHTWDWFCLDRVRYRGRDITVVWDRDGTRCSKETGLMLYVDGRLAARSERLESLRCGLR